MESNGSFTSLDIKADLEESVAKHNRVAVTHAPVPSFAKYANLAEIHPYQWLRTPHSGSVRSFSAWRGKLDMNNER